MFKLTIFAVLSAVVAARPSYFASSPVVYSSHHYVQPIVKSTYAVPVVHNAVVAPVVQSFSSPVLRIVAAGPVVHNAVVAPAVHSFSSPVLRTVAVPAVPSIHTPVLHSSPVYQSYGAIPVSRTYAAAYGPYKQ